ncbi:hypothetical protein BMF77_pa00031 (plasmid) [Dolichospermum sp. UHCC 0315A]|uniref:hypothetical protein n=1 Tax=Dolichospermum sp. UHCC 0315A TaxID=1914871 RepID=UPI0011E75401|nr:hypothetical protein [Dolichospermum sp. UHCC 0315A]QEI44316.1 hypothetical protein BMF77_04948 [Dolichospermum sp. UHCC 0315A]QEI44373.1 hypothetical protein BMF77_pa00031 [Dolichospermum sp. UHCC 0315A]
MNNVSELALNYLQSYSFQDFEYYADFLSEACEIHPPPHGMTWYGDLYRQLARKPEWFANSLIINANKEGYGSRQIWKFSEIIENQKYVELVRGHSIDESRHSKMFITMLDILFPSAIETEFRTQLKTLSPGYTKQNHPLTEPTSPAQFMDERTVIYELIQVNLMEIRALILQLLLRPVLQAYTTPETRFKLTRMSDLLIRDEINHIGYSAYCIENYINHSNQEWVREMMIDRQAALNKLTLEEVELEGVVL